MISGNDITHKQFNLGTQLNSFKLSYQSQTIRLKSSHLFPHSSTSNNSI